MIMKTLYDILKLMYKKSKTNDFRNCDTKWFLPNEDVKPINEKDR